MIGDKVKAVRKPLEAGGSPEDKEKYKSKEKNIVKKPKRTSKVPGSKRRVTVSKKKNTNLQFNNTPNENNNIKDLDDRNEGLPEVIIEDEPSPTKTTYVRVGSQEEAELSLVEKYPEAFEGEKYPNIYSGGLWARSRHPNLFFDVLFWFGMAIGGLNDYSMSFIGFAGPAFLYIVMYCGTVPITDQYMRETRPKFNEYYKETNGFVPFFKISNPF